MMLCFKQSIEILLIFSITFRCSLATFNFDFGNGNKIIIVEDAKVCFRRILAGKRVASQWVRRTLICGRLEDCQHECGEEKRFICEGFNYRLDPSGQGQGECELIEVPLSQMNLYSSHHNRDANLIRHPDYDYFERDRTSANCRTSPCLDCSGSNIKPTTYRPPSTYKPFFNSYESTAIDKYRPQHQIQPENHEPDRYDNFEPPRTYPLAGIDNYRPQQHHYSENRPPFFGMDIDRYGVDSNEYGYKPAQRPPLPSTGSGYLPFKPSYIQNQKPHNEHHIPPIDYHNRPDPHIPSPHKPFDITSGYGNEQSHHVNPPRPGYLDRDSPPSNYGSNKPSNFVPYLIGQDAQKSWGLYGGTYGQASTGQTQYRPQIDYWGLRNDVKRKDGPNFNYFELGAGEEMNNKYGPTSYGMSHISHPNHVSHTNQNNQWIRRPGSEDCSVKSSEGFRLHKGVVRGAYSVPNVHECEKMCFSESKFRCSTFSYRYSNPSRDNCLLCDRSYNLLDFYADIEPDRNNDIYSMSDDINICKKELPTRGQTSKEQCFLRSVESKRFYKAIVRDSLTARSIEDCQTECIRASKFTCRSFTFRFGSKSTGTIIDNCLLSDWPVRDMDKDRHLIDDQSFDVFERASYGYGCEIEQKEVDEKNVKLCYLGYGSSAKLTSNAIKKVITAQSELECKNECIRYRESSPFKCLSFSYGSHASTFNCEMSDLDQSELKNGIHFAHTVDRDFWLFSWVLDNTCRDKITTLGGGNRINSERRIDIFREPGGETQHYTVSGLPCRKSTKCEKNLISGFYSCEMENGEVGAWEYCCRESSVCGYSHGFSYSWCYVGDKGDQWRQCTSRSLNIIKTQYPNRKGDHFQRPPIPGGFRYRHLDEIPSASDRMSYELPLNSTLSNEISDNSIIDCKKDKNC